MSKTAPAGLAAAFDIFGEFFRKATVNLNITHQQGSSTIRIGVFLICSRHCETSNFPHV